MNAADYRAAKAEPRDMGPLPARPWDPELREAMMAAGAPIYEEQLRAEVLAATAGDAK